MLSIPEGDDKVAKYPLMFTDTDCLVLTKCDMLPYFDFDLERVTADYRGVNPQGPLFGCRSAPATAWMSWPPIWPDASVPRWPEPGARRVHILAAGIVQGVGFRPFLHRLAARLGLGGWARNTPAGVEMELEGPPDAIEAFIRALRTEPPPLAAVEQLDVQPMAALGETSFAIRPSTAGSAATLAAPDLAPCPACLREMADPAGRRYRYPFINCTDCGPRSPSSGPFPMTGPTLRWPALPCAGTVPPSMPTSAAAATTRSPTAAPSAAPISFIWTRKAGRSPATPSPWPSRPWPPADGGGQRHRRHPPGLQRPG